MHPLDNILYRALVGRLVWQVEARLDRERVLGARPLASKGSWVLESYVPAMRRRRQLLMEWIAADPAGVLVKLDVRQFFPTVTRTLLARLLSQEGMGPKATLDLLLVWLSRLERRWGIAGLPVGVEPSRVLGNFVLFPADRYLRARGVSFLRYMDDTWLQLSAHAPCDEVIGGYSDACGELGLSLNDDKTDRLVGPGREVAVSDDAIEYFGLSDSNEEAEDDGDARSLFAFAAEEPVARRAALRRSLPELGRRRDLLPLSYLTRDIDLLRPAIKQWGDYLRQLLESRHTRRELDLDWMAGHATAHADSADTYRPLTFLRLFNEGRCDLSKERGRQLLQVVDAGESLAPPLRATAAAAWRKSKFWRPKRALDRIEVSDDYSVRRALAVGLVGEQNARKRSVWADKMRDLDCELEPMALLIERG